MRFASLTNTEGGTEYLKVIPTSESGKFTFESFMKIGLEDFYTTELLGFTKDGSILYMLDSRNRDLNVLKEIHIETGVEKIIAEAKKAEISSIMVHPYTGVVQAFSEKYLRSDWTSLDKEFGMHRAVLEENLKGEIAIKRTLDDELWLVANLKDDGPVSYYLYYKKQKNLKFLFNHREDLNQYKLAKMEGVTIKARDGLELTAYLTKPLNTKNPAPLVLVVHGGPHARDDWGYDSEAQWLANRGYAVLQVNYRGSTGFGKSFIAKANLEWGGKMHEDLLDAVNWAVKEGVADPTKIAIYGGSYGGYAALWGATNSSDVFKCAVDIVGPSNLHTLLETIPPYWATYREVEYREIGDPRTEAGRNLLTERSPLTHVGNIKIPVLIAQGEKDPRVKQAESEQIVAAMKKKNLPFIYMLFMNEGHGFARPENKLAFYAITERFLADTLGGEFEDFSNELEKSTLDIDHKKELTTRFCH